MRQQNWFCTLDGFAGILTFDSFYIYIGKVVKILWEGQFQRWPTRIATPWWRAHFASSWKYDQPHSYKLSKTPLKCPSHLEKFQWLIWKVSAPSSQSARWNNSAGTLHLNRKSNVIAYHHILTANLGLNRKIYVLPIPWTRPFSEAHPYEYDDGPSYYVLVGTNTVPTLGAELAGRGVVLTSAVR